MVDRTSTSNYCLENCTQKDIMASRQSQNKRRSLTVLVISSGKWQLTVSKLHIVEANKSHGIPYILYLFSCRLAHNLVPKAFWYLGMGCD